MEIIYESEIFAKDAKAIFPFQIVIEADTEGESKEVRVLRREFAHNDVTREIKTDFLTGSIWIE